MIDGFTIPPDFAKLKLADLSAGDFLAAVVAYNRESAGVRTGFSSPGSGSIEFVSAAATGDPTTTPLPAINLSVTVVGGLLRRTIYLRAARDADSDLLAANPFALGQNAGTLNFYRGNVLLGRLPVDTSGRSSQVANVNGAAGARPVTYSVTLAVPSANSYSGNVSAANISAAARPALVTMTRSDGASRLFVLPATLDVFADVTRVEYVNAAWKSSGANTGTEEVIFFLGVASGL